MRKLIHSPNLGIMLFRLFVGVAMAFGHGLQKIPPSEMLIDGVAKIGFPLPIFFAWAAALSEFAGGILIALGLFTRHASLFMGFTMFVAFSTFHAADPFSKKEMALLYFFCCVLLFFQGAGRYSLDRFIRKKMELH